MSDCSLFNEQSQKCWKCSTTSSANKIEELKIDANSLYLALAETDFGDCIRPKIKAELERLRSKDCDDGFNADPFGKFVPRTYCVKHKNNDKENLDWSEESSNVQRRYVSLATRIAATILLRTNSNEVVKSPTKVCLNRMVTDP